MTIKRIGIAIAMFVAGVTATHAQGAPVCTYQSETYSDGAYVCAQRSLMQQCAVSGTSATWKIVADKDLNKLCLGPIVRRETSRRVAKLRIHRRAATAAVVDPNAKCFQFNGKKYCE